MAPRTLVPALLAALLLPTTLGHSSLPVNGVANGSFEDDFQDWDSWPFNFAGVTLPGPGTQGSLQYLSVPNHPGQNYLYQTIGAAFDPWIVQYQAATVLDFDARMTTAPTYPAAYQIVQVQKGYWQQQTGAGNVIAQVGLLQHENAGNVYATIKVAIYTSNTNVGYYTMSGPSDSAWHHYSLALDPATRSGELFIDGQPAMQVRQPGWPNGPAPAEPQFVLVGDLLEDADFGPSPHVEFDEIYFGPGTVVF